MPYFPTSQEWLDQSSLLLQARPSTTRISTKYSIKPPKKRRTTKENAGSSEGTNTADTSAATPPAFRAVLVLKTYDPVSGVCLKYATDKAAEVGRLISSLGRLGRTMAGLPDLEETTGTNGDVDMADAPQDASGVAAASDVQQRNSGTATPTGGGQSGGVGRKKKKGKK